MKPVMLLGLLVCLPVLAQAQTFRCSDRIISTGTSRAEVVGLCGDPTSVEHKTIYNSISAGADVPANVSVGQSVEIQVEYWLYNFGPDKLMQRIRFEDGIVVHIESAGFGF
jgi:hypothetical protein